LSLVLTLLAIPVLYTFFDDLSGVPSRIAATWRRWWGSAAYDSIPPQSEPSR
jgi:hypothetical protein